MKEIIKKDAPQYIIFRKNNNGKEYYDGANLYGKDSDGVLRIAKAKWSKEFHSAYATYDFDKMNEILNGMHKYGEIEKGYHYFIAKIQTTTAIINYIEQK